MSTLRNLLDIMVLPQEIMNITRTSDGYFLGQEYGDIGFNRFFGRPNPSSPSTFEFIWQRFRKLSLNERKALIKMARLKGVDLRVFLRRGY